MNPRRLLAVATFVSLVGLILLVVVDVAYFLPVSHAAPLAPDPARGIIYPYENRHQIHYLGWFAHAFDRIFEVCLFYIFGPILVIGFIVSRLLGWDREGK